MHAPATLAPATSASGAEVVGQGEASRPANPAPADPVALPRPNVLWVVWDTVRADHLSVYGYDKPTTPRLKKWAEHALVFDNVMSPAGSTIPSHASMFTGQLPSEHGTSDASPTLHPDHETIAERLRTHGYQTYLWAANPNLAAVRNFHQGFERAEHPWSLDFAREAFQIIQEKLPAKDRSSELREKLRQRKAIPWAIKAAGALAQKGVERFLQERDPNRPWFVFLNYMEAHRPFIPAESYRQKLMSPEDVELSYQVDRSWDTMWAYTFGLSEYTAREIEIMAATYDATLRELDDLFARLLRQLRRQGILQDTVVILTSDHGELLGEHHLMDHQYSLYDPLIRVPLIVYGPRWFKPGRSAAPVSTLDLYPTVLELAGIEDSRPSAHAVSLLQPSVERARLSEYPAIFEAPFAAIRERSPEFKFNAFARRLRALRVGPHKLLEADDGAYELYDVQQDPTEQNNLATREQELAERLQQQLREWAERMPVPLFRAAASNLSPAEIEMLQNLGYTQSTPAETNPSTASDSTSWFITDRKRQATTNTESGTDTPPR